MGNMTCVPQVIRVFRIKTFRVGSPHTGNFLAMNPEKPRQNHNATPSYVVAAGVVPEIEQGRLLQAARSGPLGGWQLLLEVQPVAANMMPDIGLSGRRPFDRCQAGVRRLPAFKLCNSLIGSILTRRIQAFILTIQYLERPLPSHVE